jgi:hypothetical protein
VNLPIVTEDVDTFAKVMLQIFPESLIVQKQFGAEFQIELNVHTVADALVQFPFTGSPSSFVTVPVADILQEFDIGLVASEVVTTFLKLPMIFRVATKSAPCFWQDILNPLSVSVAPWLQTIVIPEDEAFVFMSHAISVAVVWVFVVA